MTAAGILEIMAPFAGAFIMIFAIAAVGWLCFCIHSVARAADALERIADALEDDDCRDLGDDEKGGAK